MRVAGARICGVDAGTCTALCAGRVRVELAAGRVRVVIGAGAGRAWFEKFFVQVTEC